MKTPTKTAPVRVTKAKALECEIAELQYRIAQLERQNAEASNTIQYLAEHVMRQERSLDEACNALQHQSDIVQVQAIEISRRGQAVAMASEEIGRLHKELELKTHTIKGLEQYTWSKLTKVEPVESLS